ncbi:MAG: chemotaxis protein CheD [Clostridiales Family XIII bacterium]|jgi:chemotaxis protein CheD|nr:chemotaxis protein CheD [Clostridiales Family XIII bacterium]
MSENVLVGISDFKTAKKPDVLVTYALGSCVGICLIDSDTGVGGMSHIMLPDSGIKKNAGVSDRMKFADTAIGDLVNDLTRAGARKENLKAKIAGGADMFNFDGESFISTIGKRNVDAVREQLGNLGIPILSEDVGENYGRTLHFDLATGGVTVNSIGKDSNEI